MTGPERSLLRMCAAALGLLIGESLGDHRMDRPQAEKRSTLLALAEGLEMTRPANTGDITP